MTYYVLGTMSGSSLDGMDLMHATITFVHGKWEFEIVHTEQVAYTEDWKNQLKNADQLTGRELIHLDRQYGRLVADALNKFIEKHDLTYNVHVIGHHGHTVFHEPESNYTFQLGSGAEIAAITGYPTVTNLRDMDVALGGQGAPIIPVTDINLFPKHQAYINLGGICNITLKDQDDWRAMDMTYCNQLLNHFASQKGLEYDKDGSLARSGKVDTKVLEQLKNIPYLQKEGSKSLSNQTLSTWLAPFEGLSPADASATAVAHISEEIMSYLEKFLDPRMEQKVLITGGGAHHTFLIESIQELIQSKAYNIEIELPEAKIIDYKEALGMAFLAVLRWREEDTVFSTVSGASRDSIGGALWLGSH